MAVVAISLQMLFMDFDPVGKLCFQERLHLLLLHLGRGIQLDNSDKDVVPEGACRGDKRSDQGALIRVLAEAIELLGEVLLNRLAFCDCHRLPEQKKNNMRQIFGRHQSKKKKKKKPANPKKERHGSRVQKHSCYLAAIARVDVENGQDSKGGRRLVKGVFVPPLLGVQLSPSSTAQRKQLAHRTCDTDRVKVQERIGTVWGIQDSCRLGRIGRAFVSYNHGY